MRASQLDELLAKNPTGRKLRGWFNRTTNLDDLAVKCVLWGKTFMPNYFTAKTPDFHFDIIREFFSARNEYNAYPRGFGKTTIVQLCIAYSCANGWDTFIVLLEKSYDEAAEVLETVRDEFKYNELILDVYGELLKISPRGVRDESIKNREGDFFINGVRLRARGFDKNVRGLKSRQYRPSRIIGDDVESDEHIENPEMRQKYLNNYLRGVIPAASNDMGNIKFFGTILHDDSLLNTLITNHNGRVRRAWEGEGRKLLWPEYWTAEKLEEKRKQMRIEGKGDAAFYQEYFNEPVAEEDQIFKPSMFRYFNEKQLYDDLMKKSYRTYILVDPAISKKETADFTAIVCLLVNRMNEIYVVEIIRERLDPIETIKALFAMYERWQPFRVGIESVAYQKSLIYFIEEKRKEADSIVRNMVVQEIKADTDKERKIRTLQPRYAIGNVYHNQNDSMTGILESELTRFPRGATDDVIDAIAGLDQLLVPMKRPTNDNYNKFLRKKAHHRQVGY